MAALLAGVPFHIRHLADFPGVVLPPEGETSYADNALGKARAVAAATGELALADDSGIEVDALSGRPGVLSARYGGADLSDPERCRVMLEEMAGVPTERRGARFRCLIAIVRPRCGHTMAIRQRKRAPRWRAWWRASFSMRRGAPAASATIRSSSILRSARASRKSPRRRRTASVIAPRHACARANGCSPCLERLSAWAVYSPRFRGVAQPGSAPALGAGSRRFKSSHPDHTYIAPRPAVVRVLCGFSIASLDGRLGSRTSLGRSAAAQVRWLGRFPNVPALPLGR